MTALGQPVRIIVHHTVTAEDADPLDINRMHKAKFGGIGYHALVYRAAGGDWVVGDGRDDERLGAHTKGLNTGSLGVAIAGNYQYSPPSMGALGMVIGQCLSWCLTYDIDPANIYPHNAVGRTATVCPGMTPIDTIRAAVAAGIAAVRPTVHV